MTPLQRALQLRDIVLDLMKSSEPILGAGAAVPPAWERKIGRLRLAYYAPVTGHPFYGINIFGSTTPKRTARCSTSSGSTSASSCARSNAATGSASWRPMRDGECSELTAAATRANSLRTPPLPPRALAHRVLGSFPIRQSLKRCTLSWPSWLRPSVASGSSLPTIARHICALVAMSSGAVEGFVLCAA
jgi:hypothetical protein